MFTLRHTRVLEWIFGFVEISIIYISKVASELRRNDAIVSNVVLDAMILLLMSCVKKSATLRPRNKQKTETVRCGVEIHNFDIDAVTNTQY